MLRIRGLRDRPEGGRDDGDAAGGAPDGAPGCVVAETGNQVKTKPPPATPRRSPSARARILGWYVILLALSLLAALLLQRAFLLVRVSHTADEALDQAVAELRQLAGGLNPATGEPFGTDAAAVFDLFLDRNVPFEDEAVVTIVEGRRATGPTRPGRCWPHPH